MLMAPVLLLTASQSTSVPVPSAALRATANATLPDDDFPTGSMLVGQHGDTVGKVVSAEQGMVTIKTPHGLVRIPASAFVMRGSPILVGVPAARVDALARMGEAAK